MDLMSGHPWEEQRLSRGHNEAGLGAQVWVERDRVLRPATQASPGMFVGEDAHWKTGEFVNPSGPLVNWLHPGGRPTGDPWPLEFKVGRCRMFCFYSAGLIPINPDSVDRTDLGTHVGRVRCC